jgi:nucleoside-triphosphatase THEP1
MFKKASKLAIKLRLALSGASGSGKTFSALSIASQLGSSIAVIDTEHGSASRYADRFNFDVCELENHHPAKYIEAIQAAEEAGYQVIIIDSLSHAWFSELELAGKGFDGWKNVRPLERKLIDAMVSSKAHIIATMRSKTEYIMEEYKARDGKTKTAPKKIGTAPVQSAGIEYEFDVAGELNYEHILTISKSRCSELADRTFLNPGKEIADILKNWIAGSEAQPQQVATSFSKPKPVDPTAVTSSDSVFLAQQRTGIEKEFQRLRWSKEQIKNCLLGNFNLDLLIQLNEEQLGTLQKYIELFDRSTALIQELKWSPEQGKVFLQQHYEKEVRPELTYHELLEFVEHLKDYSQDEAEVEASPIHY